MSKKIMFEEWFHQCGFHKDGYDCNQVSSAHSAWNFCQAQERREIGELKKKVEELSKVRDFLESELSIALGAFSKTEKERLELEKKVEELEKKLEKAECFINHIYEISEDIDVTRQARDYLEENEG